MRQQPCTAGGIGEHDKVALSTSVSKCRDQRADLSLDSADAVAF